MCSRGAGGQRFAWHLAPWVSARRTLLGECGVVCIVEPWAPPAASVASPGGAVSGARPPGAESTAGKGAKRRGGVFFGAMAAVDSLLLALPARPPRRCANCGETHEARICPKPAIPVTERKCWTCGEKHMARDCPQKKKGPIKAIEDGSISAITASALNGFFAVDHEGYQMARGASRASRSSSWGAYWNSRI